MRKTRRRWSLGNQVQGSLRTAVPRPRPRPHTRLPTTVRDATTPRTHRGLALQLYRVAEGTSTENTHAPLKKGP